MCTFDAVLLVCVCVVVLGRGGEVSFTHAQSKLHVRKVHNIGKACQGMKFADIRVVLQPSPAKKGMASNFIVTVFSLHSACLLPLLP